MLVHVYGNPCDMDVVTTIANKHNLQIIEDSCESMGAYYKDKPVGSFGRVATFSFYYSHHITTLEGGICVTNDYELAENMRILRAHGWSREAEQHDKYVAENKEIDPRFIFVNLGYNLRPTEVQACMGQIQLPKLAGLVDKRRAAQKDLRTRFNKYSDFFNFQEETQGGRSSWFGFGFTLKSSAPFTVSEITEFLQNKKIETRPIIAGNVAAHPVMKDYEHRVAGSLDAANNIMRNGFAIGCHHGVSIQARDYIEQVFADFMKGKGISQAA